MSPSCVLADNPAAAHRQHLPLPHPPASAAATGSGGDLSPFKGPPSPLMALTSAAASLGAAASAATTKEASRRPLSTVPALHGPGSATGGATGGSGSVWRSKSHGGCFRNQLVAPCDDDDDGDDGDDGDEKEEGDDEEGGDDWLVTYSRTSSSYTQPVPVSASGSPVNGALRRSATAEPRVERPLQPVTATSHHYQGNPLAFGAAVAAAALASASTSVAAMAAESAGSVEAEEEDFNAWMMGAVGAGTGGPAPTSRGSCRGGARGGRHFSSLKGRGAAKGAEDGPISNNRGCRSSRDSDTDGDESEWCSAVGMGSTRDQNERRNSGGGGRRPSPRISSSSRRRNAMEYSELDAIRERLLHATHLWAVTSDSPTDCAATVAAAAAGDNGATSAVARETSGGTIAVAAASPVGSRSPSLVQTTAEAVVAGEGVSGAAGSGSAPANATASPITTIATTTAITAATTSTMIRTRVRTRTMSASGSAAVMALQAASPSSAVMAGVPLVPAAGRGGKTEGSGADTALASSSAAAADSPFGLPFPGASTAPAAGAPEQCCSDLSTRLGGSTTRILQAHSLAASTAAHAHGSTAPYAVHDTSAAVASTMASPTAAATHGLTSPTNGVVPLAPESVVSRFSSFILRRFGSPFPITRSSTYPNL
ncbi:hypothetical protein CLOM_g13053 [Closterium sp. NIES-68]|nr:hypothetical protein CLOM_g13053 [Closterium sp. NIES-68]GJP86214.1 hypothetical protein CLOP_g16264 [Closterium sp. NIES-67]